MQKKHFKNLLWGILFLVSMAMPQKASASWTSCIRNESYSIHYPDLPYTQQKSFWVGVFNYDGKKNAYFSGDVWVTLDGTNAVKLNDLWSMVSSSGDESNYTKNKSNKNIIGRDKTVTVNGIEILVRCEAYYNNWDIDKNQGGGKWTMLDMYVRVYDLRKHTVALSGNFHDADANTNYQISKKASWTIGFPHVTSVTVTQTNKWDVNVSWTASEQPTEGSWLVFPNADGDTSTTIDVNSMSAEIPYSKHGTSCGAYIDFYVMYVPKGFEVPTMCDDIIKLNLYSHNSPVKTVLIV